VGGARSASRGCLPALSSENFHASWAVVAPPPFRIIVSSPTGDTCITRTVRVCLCCEATSLASGAELYLRAYFPVLDASLAFPSRYAYYLSPEHAFSTVLAALDIPVSSRVCPAEYRTCLRALVLVTIIFTLETTLHHSPHSPGRPCATTACSADPGTSISLFHVTVVLHWRWTCL
jgi:hypothetical protein